MGGSIMAASTDVVSALLWSVVFVLALVGLVLFVLALVRWEMNAWKYVLLVPALLIPFAGSAAGWIALFAGGTKRRITPDDDPTFPPPVI